MSTRAYNYDKAHPGRCGHGWCTDCAKRRGRNFGNRRIRHGIKIALRLGRTEQ